MQPKQIRSGKRTFSSVIQLGSVWSAAYLALACGQAPYREEPRNQKRDGLVITEIVGEKWGHLGGEVAFVGDLDVDGYDDFALLASSRSDRSPSGTTGSLYLFYGRETFPERLDVSEADLVLRGAHESVAALGDVDRDGYPDFAFTANCDNEACQDTNGVILVYGASERYEGEIASEQVGSIWTLESSQARYNRVSSAGDVNADGHADLLFDVSIPESDHDTPTRRSGFLSLGRKDRSEQMPEGTNFDARFDARGDGESERFIGLKSAGDIDADGHADLILATVNQSDPDVSHHAIWLYYGSDELEHTQFDRNVADASFAWSEADHGTSYMNEGADRLGDLDGDGYDELAFATATPGTEVFHVVNGRGDRFVGLQDLDAVSWSFTTPSGYANQLVSGDIDADGQLDLLIGDWEDSEISYHAGALLAFLAPGDASPESRELSQSDVLLYGVKRFSGANDRLGRSVASGGDVNADGYDDILVTAPGDFIGDVEGGRAFLVFGSDLD